MSRESVGMFIGFCQERDGGRGIPIALIIHSLDPTLQEIVIGRNSVDGIVIVVVMSIRRDKLG